VAVDNDRNPREYCGHFWVDSIVFDRKQMELILELFGSKRICLGSDYPFPLGELNTGHLIDSMSLEQGTKEDLFQNAAREWLGIKDPEPERIA
jgi:aminocarboxymuconate-semialdehyde decarboxylase